MFTRVNTLKIECKIHAIFSENLNNGPLMAFICEPLFVAVRLVLIT
jgi:hypothetical protein